MIVVLLLPPLLATAAADKYPVIVPGSRFSDYEKYEPLIKENSVSPAEARAKIERWIKEKQDPKIPDEVGEFEGMLNDEYLFSFKGMAHKKGFAIHGHRFNVKDETIRYVNGKTASDELNGKFPKGYIPFGELRKYIKRSKD